MAEPVERWLLWLRKIVYFLTPYTGDIANPTFIFDELWEEYGSVRQVLPRIPLKIVRLIRIRARETFCLRMTIGQFCILAFFSLTVMNPVLFLDMLLTFAALHVRETYLVPKERTEKVEFITAIITTAVMAMLYGVLASIFPEWALPSDLVTTRIGASALAIGLFRYNYAPEAGAAHPFKWLLRRHESQWWVNVLWIGIATAYVLSVDYAAPPKWGIQGFLTTFLPITLFTTSIRLQLNPIGGRYRHSMIRILLLMDPYEDEIRMKRDYLLCGADWCKNFTLQSLFEILAFALGLAPLLIGVWQWYTGDPNAARINWLQMPVNGAAWIVLITTWPYLKKQNRETRALFDQTIQTFSRGPKDFCNISAPSIVLSVEGQL